MKITPPSELPPALAQTGPARPAKNAALAAQETGRGAPAAASAAASRTASSAALRPDAMASSPVGREAFDADKVQSLRAAIAQGVYRVDASAIADKMLADAQDLLSRPRS